MECVARPVTAAERLATSRIGCHRHRDTRGSAIEGLAASGSARDVRASALPCLLATCVRTAAEATRLDPPILALAGTRHPNLLPRAPPWRAQWFTSYTKKVQMSIWTVKKYKTPFAQVTWSRSDFT